MKALREIEVNDGCKVSGPDTVTNLETSSAGTENICGSNTMNGSMSAHHEASPQLKKGPLVQGNCIAECGRDGPEGSSKLQADSGEMKTESSDFSELPSGSHSSSFQSRDTNTFADMCPTAKVVDVDPLLNVISYLEISSLKCFPFFEQVTGATVQVQKKPTGAFGALLGNAVAKRKFDTDRKVSVLTV